MEHGSRMVLKGGVYSGTAQSGKDVPQDWNEAVEWCSYVLDKGNAETLNRLVGF